MNNKLSTSVLAPFATFIAMFIGAGFISGSIVHFGEGITTWDVSVLIIGIIFFVVGSYIQETVYENKDVLHTRLVSFLFFSLLLSIGVGMASGGTQHFIDTPQYSAVLIPIGLALGCVAYIWKTRIQLQTRQWIVLICATTICMPILWILLLHVNAMLPESLREGHGSHGSGHHAVYSPDDATQSEIDMAHMMGITVEELRSQTPEEHMQMMVALAKKNEVEMFAPGEGTDLHTLLEAQQTEVIEVKDGDRIELHPTLVRKTINGKTFAMYGYNGQIPGPIIKASQGATITVDVVNKIDMETTIHWHGLRHNYKQDGVPNVSQNVIEPEGTHTYTVHFPDEGVYWYHPHVREDIQQDLGLYGNLLVAPEESDAYAPVNQTEVIVLDDLLLEEDGVTPYGKDGATRSLMGRFGNTVLTNGKPVLDLYARKGSVVRLYVTNVANTRTFNFSFNGPSGSSKMKLVGSDIGRYEKEQWVDSVIIAPAERYIVDVLFEEEGTYELQHISPLNELSLAHVHVLAEDDPQQPYLTNELSSESYSKDFYELRNNIDVMSDIDAFRPYFDKPIDKELELSIELGGGMDHSNMHHEMEHGIEWEDTMALMNEMMTEDEVHWKLIDTETGNENHMINWEFTKGDVVKIRIHNNADSPHPMQHPIHFHGQRFLVLDVDGKRQQNLVWKDTVLVPTGSTVDLLFDMSNPGEWMFHCHIAEHLTNGMMGMFTVSE